MKTIDIAMGPHAGQPEPTMLRIWISAKGANRGAIRISENAGAFRPVVFFDLHGNLDDAGVIDIPSIGPNAEVVYEIAALNSSRTASDLNQDVKSGQLTIDWVNGGGASSAGHIVIDADKTMTRSLKSAPPADSHDISFFVGSCRDQWSNKRADPLLRKMASLQKQNVGGQISKRADFTLLMGDQIYIDHGGDGPKRSPFPYQKYSDIYKTAFARPAFGDLLAETPTFMMFDDHEIWNDWSRRKVEKAPSNEKEKKNKKESLVNGLTAFSIYQASLGPSLLPSEDFGVFADRSKMMDRLQYYEFSAGAHRFFVLDIRGEKEGTELIEQALGSRQAKKFNEWLGKSCPGLRFVVCPVPLFPDAKSIFGVARTKYWEEGLAKSRAALLDRLQKSGEPIILLSGDYHASFAAQLSDISDSNQPEDLPIYTIASSALHWLSPGMRKLVVKDIKAPPDEGHNAAPTSVKPGVWRPKPLALEDATPKGRKPVDIFRLNNFGRIRVSRFGNSNTYTLTYDIFSRISLLKPKTIVRRRSVKFEVTKP